MTGCQPAPLLNYPAGFREFAYVANRAGNSVTILDLVYLRVDRTLAVGTAPVALAVNPKRNEVYAVNQGSSSITVLDTDRNMVRATIPTPREPIAVAVDPTGQRAYVLSRGADSVIVIDLVTERVIASAPAGSQPEGLALAPDARSLIVSNPGSGSISLFALTPPPPEPGGPVQPAAATPSIPIRLRTVFKGCPGARSPVFTSDSAKAFVACTDSNQVEALSIAAAAGSWNARQDPTLLVDHPLALLDVGLHPRILTVKPDGGEVFASNTDSDSISEISAQTDEVLSTYSIGSQPSRAVVNADNSVLWVANAGASSVSVYSIDDGSRLPPVRTGNAPSALAFSADQALLLAADTGSGDVAVIRTQAKPGPGLLTILPAGSQPCAIVVKAMPSKPLG